MENTRVVNFRVDQLAEIRTFEHGYRGAWFRCKILDIHPNNEEIFLEYSDFEAEDPSWVKLYQVPSYDRRSRFPNKQLMVRPQYPAMYQKSEMPHVSSTLQQPCIVIDGNWKVGDMVDWNKDGCYWSATIVRLVSNDKVEIELTQPPLGEGGKHEAFCNDIRPSLDWSETEGWLLPTKEGQTSCDAHLVFPQDIISVEDLTDFDETDQEIYGRLEHTHSTQEDN